MNAERTARDQFRPAPIPLRPDFNHAREASLRSITRAAIHLARHASDRNRPPLGDDHIGGLVLRSATAPLKLSDAQGLAQVAQHFVASLQPTSASAQVLAKSLSVSLDQAAQVSVPGITLPLAAWLAEAGPIPVQAGTTSTGAVIDPHKLGMILTLTGEMYRSSNAEAVFRQNMIESAGPTLDSVFFSTAAGVPGQQPAGILNGIASLTPTPSGQNAMAEDLGNIATALAPVSGSGQPIIVASPAQAMVLNVVAVNPGTVYSCASLPAKTVVGLVPEAVVSAIESPRIELAASGTLHMAAPANDIVTGPSPGVVAAPTRELFQTDTVALRLVWPVTWSRRSNSAVCWIQNCNW
ncbi:hypothetical protein [Bradyrhizobium sp. Cp5.3]|uniref:hypothetical protein n=1 Tax=Bradyrhizobium sp. Cp5.3 TaxID=443598 RepID=UPI0004281597|nr:hypothetical protein [Bradyrhizobium sp. Cp5.3]